MLNPTILLFLQRHKNASFGSHLFPEHHILVQEGTQPALRKTRIVVPKQFLAYILIFCVDILIFWVDTSDILSGYSNTIPLAILSCWVVPRLNCCVISHILKNKIKICISSPLPFTAHEFLNEKEVLISGLDLFNDITSLVMTSFLACSRHHGYLGHNQGV